MEVQLWLHRKLDFYQNANIHRRVKGDGKAPLTYEMRKQTEKMDKPNKQSKQKHTHVILLYRTTSAPFESD